MARRIPIKYFGADVAYTQSGLRFFPWNVRCREKKRRNRQRGFSGTFLFNMLGRTIHSSGDRAVSMQPCTSAQRAYFLTARAIFDASTHYRQVGNRRFLMDTFLFRIEAPADHDCNSAARHGAAFYRTRGSHPIW